MIELPAPAVRAPAAGLAGLLRDLQPERRPGVFVFATLPHGQTAKAPLGWGGAVDPATCIASIREPEGLSVILAESDARAMGLPVVPRLAWITLTVRSSLLAVGLTAAVASALTQAGIACNVVAGACHDHLFVPLDDADDALAVLRALQQAQAPRADLTRPG